MKNIYKILLYISGMAGIALFYFLYPVFFPGANINFTINSEMARSIAIREIIDLGYDTSNYVFTVQPRINQKIPSILERKYGLSKGNKLISEFDYAFFIVSAVKPMKKGEGTTIQLSNEDKEILNQNSTNPSFTLNISSTGNIIYFKRMIPDTMFAENLDSAQVYSNCMKILKKYYPDFSINTRKVDYRNNFKRMDIYYSFKGVDLRNNNLSIDIVVNGSRVGLIKKQYALEKEETNPKSDIDILKIAEVVQLIFIIILFLVLVFMVIKRYKYDEINLKFSAIFAVVFSFLFTIYFFILMMNNIPKSDGWIPILVSSIFTFLFFSAFFFVIIAGTDSISRVFWNEKFHSFDACRKGYFFSKKVQRSFFDGLALAGIYLLFFILFLIIIENIFHIDFSFYFEQDSSKSILDDSGMFSSVSFLSRTLTLSFFYILGFPVLISSILKKRLKNDYMVFGITVFLLTFIDFPSMDNPASIELFLIFNFIFSIIIVSAFLKFDLLALLWSYFLAEVISKIIFLSYINIDYSHTSLIVLSSFVAALIILFTLPIFFKNRKEVDYEDLSPKFLKRITERERISKEIDAARHIQKSFLPFDTPNFVGLEIAANCIPALEVGGDYYDYFVLDENKLGVVIADVSGKGLKAAFYMTLIKGIIKAQTQSYISPKEVVSKLNKLLYEIIEKGNFVSLIYGVFDTEKKYFIFSNAGHNPIIMKDITNGKTIYDKNEGMALGLSEETIFNKNVYEKIIPFRPGDLFVLYTDGYTEAMNRNKEEYGANTFLDLIMQNSNDSPSEIIKKTEMEIKKYIGKAQQHDDMTMVAIRVK
jgi:hypothetical protein